jgi:pyruvate ferredoxin oxidoreductase beta subunit
VPVTDYLRLQARYAHLFRPEERTDVIARIQASADRNVSRFGLLQDHHPERKQPSLNAHPSPEGR